jgi:surfactin family lipopeptide synthetase A
MRELKSRIADLSPEERNQLLQQLKKKKTPAVKIQKVTCHRDFERFPLSFAQKRLWFLEQLESGTSTYNIPNAIRIQGELKIPILEASLNEIIKRHEALRTTFAMMNGQPVQIISPPQALTLTIVDLEKIHQAQQEAQILQIATTEAQQPFDLMKDLLLRVKLLRLSKQEHVLLLTMHHIVADGWSIGILLREMTALYEAFFQGQPSPLPNLEIQYADFAAWQREYLQGEVLQTLLSYWKKQLAGVPSLLKLPTNRPRPTVSSFRGASKDVVLSPELSLALNALSKQSGVTLFMTLLAAFQILLYRYTGQVDIPVGTPIANRNRSETEGLIGFFVNTLVMNTSIHGNPTFRELLKRVKEVALGAYTHQDMPFEKLVEELQPARDLSHNPLFQVMFVLQNTPLPDLKLGDLTLTLMALESQTAKFDLTLSLQNTKQGLIGAFEYNTALFDASTIERMAGHFQTLLESIIANPEQEIDSLPLLTAKEKQTLVDWNQTQKDYNLNVCLHQLIEAQVERSPFAKAVVFKQQQLTYNELNSCANKVARYLRQLGVKPNTLVGICMERSLEMVVGILGILKAGGAYVPIDPTYPKERLDWILEDAQISVLLTQERLLERLTLKNMHLICLDTAWESIARESDQNLTLDICGNNLAYVIYTSGSTGKPKGVLVTHQNLVNSTTARIAYYQEPVTSFLLLSSFAFDSSVAGIFWTLCSGGMLYLTQEGLQRELPQLIELIAQNSISHLLSLPSLYTLILEQAKPEQLISLRTVIVAGEPCPKQLVQRHFLLQSKTSLFNEYGPTEGTVWSSVYRCNPEFMQTQVPIGRPIVNTQIYILDSQKHPVPVGIPGELYIGGTGLAQGYLNRPDLTAEKFLPNPFSNQPGVRLYKTGDLARYLSNGNIEYIGRCDRQVKIRGFRIELGEIEAALSQYPEVRETVVIAKEDASGEKRLVAYLVTKEQLPLAVNELRVFLMERLPDYMIPTAFVLLESLPLTPNGKVDCEALPPPNQTRPDSEKTFVSPRNSVEQLLTETWKQVLELEVISIHDNFFEIGGHSLLGVQLISKINQKFGTPLLLSTLFKFPTIAELATQIEKEPTTALPESLVPIQAEGTQPPLFCIHPAGGEVMVYQHLATSLGADQPVYGLQSSALHNPENECKSIEQMAGAYANSIQAHQPNAPYYLMGWSMGGVVAVSVAKKLEQQGQKVAFVGLLDSFLVAENPSTSTNDPLAELALVFGGTLALAFAALNPAQQQELREEFAMLPIEERLRRAMMWGLERNLLSVEISLDVLLNQVKLAFTHQQLLENHHAPKIQAPLYVWWAEENFQEGVSRTDWSKYTMGTCYTQKAKGQHFSLIRPPYCQTLGNQLQECLRTLRS